MVKANPDGPPLRERLILAGIHEIERGGILDFSVRRVAGACGVSCAAPYRHFADKSAFLAAIMDYIDAQWRLRKQTVLEQTAAGSRRQLAQISLEYIRFLVENPHFRAVVMAPGEGMPARGQVSLETHSLIQAYCRSAGLSDEAARLKVYVVRSLIYGAALMLGNGEMAYTEENMALVAHAIGREFELN